MTYCRVCRLPVDTGYTPGQVCRCEPAYVVPVVTPPPDAQPPEPRIIFGPRPPLDPDEEEARGDVDIHRDLEFIPYDPEEP